MAEADTDTDTASFWLPSEFLTDDDLRGGAAPPPKTSNSFLNSFPANDGGGLIDMFGGGGGSSSALNSPGESATSSAEDNEADRDDFFAELTRHLSRTSLVERAAQKLHPQNQYQYQHLDKPWGVLATSPQSTLSGFASWSSNRSNGAVPPVGRSSQPLPAHALKNAKEEAMELIYAAAGQVARMKIRAAAEAQAQMLNSRHHHQQSSLCSNFALAPSQFQQMNKERFSLQRSTGNGCCGLGGLYESAGNGNVFGRAHHQTTPPPPVPWSSAAAVRAQPHLHNNHNHNLNLRATTLPPPCSDCVGVGGCGSNGMNAVFLGGSGAVAPKKQSTGTGVFLPRRFPTNNNTTTSESRKKQGCPSPSPSPTTVLLPPRGVHASNSNLDEVNSCRPHPQPQSRSRAQLPCLVSNQVADNIAGRRNAFSAQQKRTSRLEDSAAAPPPPTAHHELLLPKDWTY